MVRYLGQWTPLLRSAQHPAPAPKTQAQWPFDRTIMVNVMPDSRGYMPTDAAFGLPLEKAIPNRLQPGYVESAIFRAFTKLMDEYIPLNN